MLKMTITLEEAVKLLGKAYVPKEIFTDPRMQKEWLELLDIEINEEGEQWAKDNKKMMLSAWSLIRTLV
jgi:hypothetical protein